MNIVLAPDGPLHAGATLARYHLWGEDPANRLADGALLRVLRYHGRLVPYGVRPTLAPTPLEMLVGSISAQQVNLQFAFACRARLVRRWGTPLTLGRHTVWAFPDGAALAQARLREFRAMKFSRRKGEYIRDLARAVVSGRLDLDALAATPSEAVIDRLPQQSGLGRWTADWFLARCLGRGDVCAAGDLGVRRAFEHFYGRGRTRSEEAIRRRARACACGACAALDSLTQAMAWPQEINRTDDGLRVTWGDAHVSLYPYPALRGLCRCASCTGGH